MQKYKLEKIRAILPDFPRRSEKAAAAKFREKFPQIYYQQETDRGDCFY